MSMSIRRRMLSTSSGEMPPAWTGKISGIAGFSLSGKTISDDIVLDFGDLPVSNFLMSKVTISKPDTVVEIKCGTLSFATEAFGSYGKATNPWTLKLSCTNNPEAGSELTRNSSCTRIIGKALNVSTFGNGTYRRFNSTNLVEFYLLPNRVTLGESGITTGTLIDASVISVANGLKEGLETQQTITISNAATKAKLDTIVGTVSVVDDGDTTYHLFAEDAGGETTLRNFIENTKGWVIA